MCWLPALLADFPGGFRYDATGELNQIVDGYNQNYPFLHSFLVTRIIPFLYKITGNYNVGITVFVILQMLFASFVFSSIVYYFAREKTNKIIASLLLVYFCLFPVVQILVVQEVRDVLFSVLFTYTIFLLFRLFTEDGFLNNKNSFLIPLIIVLTILSRNNNTGLLSIVIVIVVGLIIWFCKRKEDIKQRCIFIVALIVFYFAINGFLVYSCSPIVNKSGNASRSILTQPLARTYIYDYDNMNEYEKTEIKKFIYSDNKQINYCAENGDSTIWSIGPNGHTKEFIIFWIKTGLNHKQCYADAILANSQNAWYPSSVIDGYNQRFASESYNPYINTEKCYYSIRNKIESPGFHSSKIPWLLKFYENIGLYISFEKIPVISMLFSIGFQNWLLLFAIFFFVYLKEYKLLIPSLLVLTYSLIASFAPLVLLRYFAGLFFTIPMILAFMFEAKKQETNISDN